MNEISTMVEALEGEPHTIKVWATRNNGVITMNEILSCTNKIWREPCAKPRILKKGKGILLIQE
jgi:hypothetical protein